MIVKSALKRIPTPAVMIQPCRTGNQEAPLRFIAVLQAFHKIPPTSKLVDFVEQNEWLFRRQGPLAKHFPRRGIIPRQVGSVVLRRGFQQAQG